jgi:hypothetical protein
VVEKGGVEILEVDWSVDTVTSRVTAPDAEPPNSEIKAKVSNGKSQLNFPAIIRSGLMGYLMECFLNKRIALAGSGNAGSCLAHKDYKVSLRLISGPL